MIIQIVNAFAHIVAPLLAVGISSRNDASLAFILAAALANLSWLPKNVLLIIFLKPVWDEVRRWLCCCC